MTEAEVLILCSVASHRIAVFEDVIRRRRYQQRGRQEAHRSGRRTHQSQGQGPGSLFLPLQFLGFMPSICSLRASFCSIMFFSDAFDHRFVTLIT